MFLPVKMSSTSSPLSDDTEIHEILNQNAHNKLLFLVHVTNQSSGVDFLFYYHMLIISIFS